MSASWKANLYTFSYFVGLEIVGLLRIFVVVFFLACAVKLNQSFEYTVATILSVYYYNNQQTIAKLCMKKKYQHDCVDWRRNDVAKKKYPPVSLPDAMEQGKRS